MDTGDHPRLLADLDACLAQAPAEQGGAVWRLAEPSRQLDANLVRLPANATVAPHTEGELDVLLVGVAGSGTLHTDAGAIALAEHAVAWLPRGSRRAVTAGPDGLAYLTTHRARTGMRILLPQDPEALRRLEEREEEGGEGGDAACWLARVCPACGALADSPLADGDPAAVCPACHTPR